MIVPYSLNLYVFTLLNLDTRIKTGTFARSAGPDEMPAFNQGLHFLLRQKQSLWALIEILTCCPFKFKMDKPVLIVSYVW